MRRSAHELFAGVNTMFAYRLITLENDPQLLLTGLLLTVLLATFAYRSLERQESGVVLSPDEG